MPEYELVISRTAQKQLDKLPDNIVDPLIDAIQALAFTPRPHGCKKPKGRNGYRIRQGTYRIIYDIFDNILTIEVIALGHRKDIYE